MRCRCIALFASAVGCALTPQFSAAEAQTKEQVLHSFRGPTGDGGNPYNASLINVEGALYGTTYNGGAHSLGTVYKLDRKTGAEEVLHNFCKRKMCTDGENPEGGLIDVNGTLYGTTNYGGDTGGGGTVFALNGVETVIYSFCEFYRKRKVICPAGDQPTTGLIDVNGTLYGTTVGGGAHAAGTVFAVDLNTGTASLLYSWCSQQNCTDGYDSRSKLIAVNGALYGTTILGGVQGGGVVFALDPNTGAETVLYPFCNQQNCADGANPVAGVIDVNETLYGTTSNGGIYGHGTVFAFDLNTGAETVLYSFCSQQNCTDGDDPEAGLIDVNGMLYGTTKVGGTYGYGTAFALDLNTGTETMLYSFCNQQNCADGANPEAGLIDVNGILYGTTFNGGTYGYGTVFRLRNP